MTVSADPEKFRGLAKKIDDAGGDGGYFEGDELQTIREALFYASQYRALVGKASDALSKVGRALAAEKEIAASRAAQHRAAVNRLDGRADNDPRKRRYDEREVVADWHDMLNGDPPSARYPTRAACGLGPVGQVRPCPDPTHATHPHPNCRHCPREFFEPPIGLSKNEIIEAIAHVHRFPSAEACYKFLQRAGVTGLPSTWEKA